MRNYRRCLSFLFGTAFLVIGCTSDDIDYDFKAKQFASQHFIESVYRSYEYEIASNPRWGGDSGAYHGTEPEWRDELWAVKIHYLPDQGFTHDLPKPSERQADPDYDEYYYDWIGRFVHQFGFGWDDVIIWGDSSHTTAISYHGDDPNSPYFDNIGNTAHNWVKYVELRSRR